MCSGLSKAGYANISTSDGIIHGQVRQADNFAFVRIYQSGHEVPFYQPVVSLEMFERVIHGKDIQTGKNKVACGSDYLTKGTPKSTHREGISTVQFSLVPVDIIYNTTTNQPNPYPGQSAGTPPINRMKLQQQKKRSNRSRWSMR